MQCDAPLIIQELKDQVLQGCVIGFTGVIPIHTPPEEAEIWKLAETFGAQCIIDLKPNMTHLVTANLQTKKMHDAGRMPGLKIVWLAWLQSCIALWKHEPEEPFRASHPAWEGAAGGEREPSPPKEEEKEDEENSDEEFLRGAQAWDDAADAEFEAFLNGSDDDDDGSLTAGEEDRLNPEGSKSPVSVLDNDE
jgi:RNA polymerase II subunit A-like phosphatase